ncbi:uncharacterized protein CC84DRAFT_1165989 [Paraphaeosphaeria sporulosa]|uniref:Pentacotripeptide-repeat region of PRORP domain-containing protein n=1 Tax=Paraphaeosphaeria sporulosa TaxID=1460663 RepID=A0A177CAH1_9PLEO|nr:uncharacterized protein CC84DRAFT_1165989 [Paraphaeosphaeria sporulosa]OAG03819.1 hypothetical protein CC84DRAFT_1165989 [Paraphaeosphaeria sporulosa]
MMRSYVCQQCRLQLPRRLAPPRHPQLLSRATIVSFRKPPKASQPADEAQQPPEAAPSEDTTAPRAQPQEPGIAYGRRDPEAPLFRYHRVDDKPSPHGDGTAPVGRYTRAAQPDVAPSRFWTMDHGDGRNSKASRPSSSSSSAVQTINTALKKGSVETAWDAFNRSFTSRDVPALTDPPLSDVPLLSGGKLFKQLALATALEFGKGNKAVPTPTQVLFRFEQLDIAPPRVWGQVIAILTYQFMRSMAPPGQRGAPEDPNESDTEATLGELLSLWRLFFQRYGKQQAKDPLESISTEWKAIPDGQVSFGEAGKYFGKRLQHFCPTHDSTPELHYSAISIFNYFHAETEPPHAISETLRQQNEPFLRLLASTLAGSNIESAFKHAEFHPMLRSLGKEYQRSIAAQMDSAPSLASTILGVDPGATPEERASHLQASFLKRIGRQVMMQANAREVEKLWGEAQKMYRSFVVGKSQIPRPIYNAFLSGTMTLFQPDQTVKIWNHMIANGVSPNLETWNAMLMGCAKAKDLAGMNAVWDRMIRAGVEPDQYSWTTRVHSTIGTHVQIDAGLAILDEMGKRWLSAEAAIKDSKNPANRKGPRKPVSNANLVNTFTKPDIGVINGAVDGIVQLPTKGSVQGRRGHGLTFESKVSYVQRILQWAGNFSIKPDTRTYNALIKLYLGGNDFPTAFKLLRQMETEGLEGDLATHTMLLRAAFDNQKFDTLSHQEQADRVIGLFDQLDQGGLKPNTYVYQIAVDRLLKYFSNYTGVRAVIDHMMSRGFLVSPQIYTSLVTHYFQQDPPAIKEVDSLVTRILGPPAAPTDRFLFDRIVEGYAGIGEIAPMMTVLTKMSAHGKRPSYRALVEVVKALYNAGEWERARGIVRDVKESTGVVKDGATTTHQVDRDQFFYAINALAPDLLEELAGDHFKAPVRAQTTQGDAGYEPAQPQHEQAQYEQQSYDQYQPQDQQNYQGGYEQQQYGQSGYEQAPYEQTPYQQPQEMDNEFVNAEHEGYLSDEPEVPHQQWTMNGAQSAGRR